MDNLFSDALSRFLSDQCTPQRVREIETGGPVQPLWDGIEASGFADLLLKEEDGGAGLDLSEAFELMQLCGRFALPAPLVETMVARALLADAGEDRPSGSVTFGQASSQSDAAVSCQLVSSGRVADWVLVDQAGECLLMPIAEATMTGAVFPLDAGLAWSAAAKARAARVQVRPDIATLRGCVYAALLSGALMVVFERTLSYANDRSQFGRPIGKFQAIQHQLSVLSEQVFAARMAAQLGCRGDVGGVDRLGVAVAKARTSEAALEVAALAHSIHGAIGFTEEFDLQLFTRRLHAWRQAGGSESHWHGVLGAALTDRPASLALDLIRTITDVK